MSTRKFKEPLVATLPNCPSKQYAGRNVSAFRLVKNSPPDVGDFEPTKISDDCYRSLDDERKCAAAGLSFFVTEEALRKRFAKLLKNNKLLLQKCGHLIAQASLSTTHGVCTMPDDKGHYTLHVYDGADITTLFAVVGEMKVQP